MGHLDAERPGGLQIYDELELRRLRDRQVSRLCALQNLARVKAALPEHVHDIGPIAHQPTGFDAFATGMGRGNPVACRESRKLDTPANEERVGCNEEYVGVVAHEG